MLVHPVGYPAIFLTKSSTDLFDRKENEQKILTFIISEENVKV